MEKSSKPSVESSSEAYSPSINSASKGFSSRSRPPGDIAPGDIVFRGWDEKIMSILI